MPDDRPGDGRTATTGSRRPSRTAGERRQTPMSLETPTKPARLAPLRDLRSLSSSVIFHAIILSVASLVVLSVALPSGQQSAPKALRAEVGPVDTRAPIAE